MPDTTETTWKPLLCLDFDGVLHSYSSGWKGADVIPDPPVPGAIEFLSEAVEHFKVAIYSSRSHQGGGIGAMKAWIWKHGCPPAVFDQIDWPTDEKPPAFVTLDDRAIQFNGTWPSMGTLKRFKPWNKREISLPGCGETWRAPSRGTATTEDETIQPPPSVLKAEQFVRFIRRHFHGVGDAAGVVVMDLDVQQVDGEAWLLTPLPGDSVTRFDGPRAGEKVAMKEGDFMAWAKDSLSKPIPGVSGPSDIKIPVTPEEDEAWTEKLTEAKWKINAQPVPAGGKVWLDPEWMSNPPPPATFDSLLQTIESQAKTIERLSKTLERERALSSMAERLDLIERTREEAEAMPPKGRYVISRFDGIDPTKLVCGICGKDVTDTRGICGDGHTWDEVEEAVLAMGAKP